MHEIGEMAEVLPENLHAIMHAWILQASAKRCVEPIHTPHNGAE